MCVYIYIQTKFYVYMYIYIPTTVKVGRFQTQVSNLSFTYVCIYVAHTRIYVSGTLDTWV